MLVLALDTSTAASSAELVELVDSADGRADGAHPDGGLTAGLVVSRAARQVVDARGHGEHLAPTIAAVLAEAMVVPGDLGAIVAGTGPGPYTGLRVGLVTATVMSSVLGIPVYGVCSLDGLVAPDSSGTVLAASDARRREVYWARYVGGERVDGPAVDRPADVPLAGCDTVTGAGATLYRDVLDLPHDGGAYPSGLVLVHRALDRLRGGAASDPLTPLYLRRPDAVVPGAAKQVTA